MATLLMLKLDYKTSPVNTMVELTGRICVETILNLNCHKYITLKCSERCLKFCMNRQQNGADFVNS
jgi:hypothetical protein